MKICHITSVHPRYDGRIFFKECLALANAGHQINLIVADDQPDEIKQGVAIYSVGKAQSRFARMQQIPQKIRLKIAELKPAVVHFHDPELMLIGLSLTKQGIKVIYDVHEDLPKQILNKHWLPKFIRPLLSSVIAQVESYCAKRFSGIIAATPIIQQRFNRYNPNSVAIRNYPILAELKVATATWSEREDKLCYIGSISQTRGIRPIVESLAISKLPLELAGQFSGDINLAELNKLDAAKLVNYLGVLNRQQIVDLLQTVKIGLVTLLPTPSYLESLPIKMFEYMLAGIPVLASNFPLWHDILVKYNCGILVDPANPLAIAQACQTLLANQQLAQQMGENGRQAVLNHFNWEKESSALCAFYRKLADG